MNNIKCIETNDKEKTCDTCKHSSTDGFLAPSYWCNKEKHHGRRGGFLYSSYVKNIGSVCEDWEKKSESVK